jgi:hypothetical protein
MRSAYSAISSNCGEGCTSNFACLEFSEVRLEGVLGGLAEGDTYGVGRYPAGSAAPETATLKAAPSGIRAASSL